MEKDRSFRSLAVIAILVAVVGVSIAFAALSQVLTINGVTKVKGGQWAVSFANLQTPTIIGDAIIDTTATLANGSTTMNFAVSLVKPTDSVTYYFDVKNSGTIDAKISAVTLTGVTEALAADVTYTLTYADGSAIAMNDTLNAGVTKNLKLVVTFNSSATSLPSSDVTLNLGATITYVQQ
jgi:hypothetical protein